VTRRILIIEEEPAMRLLVEEYLELLGYEAVGAPDGDAALALAHGSAFSLMLVDLNLPDMTGLEVMRRLRERGDRTPFVVMSGNLRDSYAAEARALGVAAVLEKPVDLDDLERAVRTHAGGGEAAA
jgi:two-component system capsular synthesis sensor histidine kinase RcsC